MTKAKRVTRENVQPMWSRMRVVAEVAATVFLTGCVARYLFLSRGWPLVNDAALMHYVVFLMQHGMAPYRQIGDINLPGAYAPEWISMRLAPLFGASPAAMWRGMDAVALLLSAAAMVRIAWRYSWFAGVFGVALFALGHGRDGIGQAGQRDLWLTMLLLGAVAALFAAMRSVHATGRLWRVAGFGLLAGAAAIVKPFGAGYLLCLAPLLWWHRGARARAVLLVAAGLGFCLPLLAAVGFVWHWGALGAFWQVLRVQLPYHAGLADGSVLQLVIASSVGSVAKLLVLLVAVASFSDGWGASIRGLWWGEHEGLVAPGGARDWRGSPERLVLIVCVLLGLLSFVAQGKGYPYQRSPYLGFLWLLAGLEFTAALGRGRRIAQVLGAVGLAYGVLVCAPVYLRSVAKAKWPTPVVQAMESAIAGQAGAGGMASLDGEVQCIDVVTGCTDALRDLGLNRGLVQATGTLYDEFLFPQTPAPWGTVYTGPAVGSALPRAVALGQQRFQAAVEARLPRVMVVSAWLFPEGPGKYGKLALWPWFERLLAVRYVLVEERKFAPAENGPMGFRVYVLRTGGFR